MLLSSEQGPHSGNFFGKSMERISILKTSLEDVSAKTSGMDAYYSQNFFERILRKI